MRSLFVVALADFKDRYRRYAFFVSLAVTLYFGYLCVPPVAETFYYTLTLGKFRGIYNSAWVGTVVAMSATSLITLFGFFLIKNTVSRDARSGVGEIIAATGISKTRYITAKVISNILYLSSLIAPLMLMSLVMLVIRGEESEIDLIKLYSPFLAIVFPALLATSALAVFFEVTPGLRRGIGNFIYFYAYMAPLILFIEFKTKLDMFAMEIVTGNMQESISAAVPSYKGGFSLGHMNQPAPAGSFLWEGIDWTPDLILTRLFWIGIAMCFTLVAIPIFSRFDPTRQSKALTRFQSRGVGAITLRLRDLFRAALAPVARTLNVFPFGRMFVAELRLALLGMPAFWYLVAFGLWIATLTAPLEVSREYLMPFLWIWPVLVWSQSGIRESRHRVDQILFSAPRPVARQLLSVWLGGITLALLTASGFVIRLAIIGEFEVITAILIGAVFVSSLALASGVVTKSSRFFEIVYLLCWYLGPINKVYALDYMGTFDQSIENGMPLFYLTFALVLAAIAFLVRSRNIRS